MSKHNKQKRDHGLENRIANLENKSTDSNRWMVFLSALMVVITLGGVVVSAVQWKTTQSLFYQDQRPYLISLAQPRQLVPNQEVMLDFHNGNYGKTPALRAGGAGYIFFGDDALKRADEWFENEAPKVFSHRYETIIPQNTPASNIEARRTTVRSHRIVGEQELSALIKKDFSIVAVMRQAYLDRAGNEYWTDSCVANLATNMPITVVSMPVVECNTHNHIE